jgi:hypothetical protein
MEDPMHGSKMGPVWMALVVAVLALATGLNDAAAMPRNITGSYSCTCLMDTGTCDMIVEAGRVRCGRSGPNPCQSSCRLDTTTSGIKGGAAAMGSAKAKAKANQ